jgi:hypothetical protein
MWQLLVPVGALRGALVLVDGGRERLHHSAGLLAVATDLGGESVVLREREGGDPAQGLLGLGRRRERERAAQVLEDGQLQVRRLAEKGEEVGRELGEVDLHGRFGLGAGTQSRHLGALALARKPIDHEPSLEACDRAGRAASALSQARRLN